MSTENVALLQPYPFRVGQKIHIDGGPRSGDWQVIGMTEKKVNLRCPVSGREFEWDRFCYFIEEREDVEWPQEHR